MKRDGMEDDRGTAQGPNGKNSFLTFFSHFPWGGEKSRLWHFLFLGRKEIYEKRLVVLLL